MLKTKKIIINGVVQGVGFRPFIYNLAIEMNINGYVLNSPDGVVIELTAEEEKIKKFIENIRLKKPKESEISSIEISEEKHKNFKDFKILKSENNSFVKTSIPADLSICEDCVKDISDPKNRRHLYPFTNCTNCGPRFSIVEKIPYDRKFTTMKKFKMCPECFKEYESPQNRRFHAQPNACPDCGPYAWVRSFDGRTIKNKWLDYIVKRIIDGNIVLIKGIGGFHIACDAFNKQAVSKLREIKRRDFKPFAVMVDNISDISGWLIVKKDEEDIFNSSKAPIIMFRKKNDSVFEYVAPNIDSVGVMKAYTPLHKIIFNKLKEKGFRNPLVMTSGNFKDEPIITDNKQACDRFSGYDILLHNRDIKNRIDDSVLFLDDFKTQRIIRRSRGFVPQSIKIKSDEDKKIFAAGADIKNCFGFYRKGEVILSQYIGDLEIKENRDFFLSSYANMKKLFDINADTVCADMHPQYHSSSMAKSLGIRNIIYVQHHVAHMCSVMAENDLEDDVLGISFDGTGYGTDGNIWGGEFFVVKNGNIKRAAHFKYVPLPGGDTVSKEIWRSFVSFFSNRMDFVYKVLKGKIERSKIEIINNMIDKKINSPLSSSVGRIFDAVSVSVTGDVVSDFEASGPMKIEHLAYKKVERPYKFDIERNGDIYVVSYDSLIDGIINDWERKRDIISAKFHSALINLIKDLSIKICRDYDIKNICVSGGVFQNRFLTNSIIKSFYRSKYNLYLNSKVPSNDGGISLGQIYYALKFNK